jgi:hypothetical protein
MPFVHVEGEQAGPSALGILVPPGRRTLLVVRPRPLDWDLLPLDPESAAPRFWEVGRDFAPRLAQELARALAAGDNRVDAIAAPDSAGYHVRAGVGRFVLIVCARRPGQAYQPLVLDSVREACAVAEQVGRFVCPAPQAEQELYLNTRHFSR